METYDPIKADKAQAAYCGDGPNFTPDRGICFRCGKSIYSAPDEKGRHGYSVEYAATYMITGCPHCHTSFVE